MTPKTIGLLILALMMLILIVQNTQIVTLRFLFFSLSMSQILMTLLTLALGFLAGYLTAKLTARSND